MYYCNNCGQCKYISDSTFIEYVDIAGTEIRYINCENGEVEDYGDTDTTSTGDSTLHCPHCNSDDVDTDWNGKEEEAFEQRAIHEANEKLNWEKMEKFRLNKSIKNSEWDLDSN